MSSDKARVELDAAILELIDRYRKQCGDASLGADIESLILKAEWGELEKDIFADPGAFEKFLLRNRPRDNE